jgi:hypothetical protein
MTGNTRSAYAPQVAGNPDRNLTVSVGLTERTTSMRPGVYQPYAVSTTTMTPDRLLGCNRPSWYAVGCKKSPSRPEVVGRR